MVSKKSPRDSIWFGFSSALRVLGGIISTTFMGYGVAAGFEKTIPLHVTGLLYQIGFNIWGFIVLVVFIWAVLVLFDWWTDTIKLFTRVWGLIH